MPMYYVSMNVCAGVNNMMKTLQYITHIIGLLCVCVCVCVHNHVLPLYDNSGHYLSHEGGVTQLYSPVEYLHASSMASPMQEM